MKINRLKAAAAVGIGLALSAGLSGCSGSEVAGDPVTAENIVGSWGFTGGETANGKLEPLGDEGVIQIDSTGHLSGTVGCNQMMGQIVVGEKGALEIGPAASTMMMCDEEVMALEAAFMGALEDVDSGHVYEGAMTLKGKKTELSFVYLGEANAESSGEIGEIEGAWILKSGTGPDGGIQISENVAPDMTIEPDGTLSASAGCNTLVFTATPGESGELSLSAGISTAMMCDSEEVMEAEAKLAAALGAVDHFELAGNTLTLTGPDAELVFTEQ